MADAIVVINLAEINGALARSGPLIRKAARIGLTEAAEPVKRDADRLSLSEISGMKRARVKPPPWSFQKIGQTRHEVYIVPKQKGIRGRRDDPRGRPNFAVIMLGKAYEPALERNQVQVRVKVDNWLGRAWSEV